MVQEVWIIRHGERIDNVDNKWRNHAPRGAWDDPPLTSRGLQQAQEVGRKLIQEEAKINYIFSSPFQRCVQTANNILAELKSNNCSEKLKIKIEPGFCESLNVCQQPPGYLTVKQLKQQFDAIDENYESVLTTEKLSLETTSICCFKRVRETLNYIHKNYIGNILIVSHGSPIAGCHIAFTGEFKYVGQCTISKYYINNSLTKNPTEFLQNNPLKQITKIKNSTKTSTINIGIDKFLCELAGDSTHLSDQTNLRDYISISEEDKKMIKKYIRS